MKKVNSVLMLLAISSLFVIASSNAQIIVRVRPHRPAVIVRTAPPSPRHVWVGEEWAPNGRAYAYHRGYWALPPRPGTIWISGHWANRPGGSVWVAGHWR